MYKDSIINIINNKIIKLNILNNNFINNDEIIKYIIINYNKSSTSNVYEYIYELIQHNVYFIYIKNVNTIKDIIKHKFNKNIKSEEIIKILNKIKNILI